ncbi:MAG: DEAD/DEAH box helicase family protein [Promethearchaeota archaeon]
MRAAYYDDLSGTEGYRDALRPNPRLDELIASVEPYLTFSLRPYQREALAALDYALSLPGDDPLKRALYENTSGFECPYYGFEMATGSGKTLLMAAAILYLHARHGVKHFLVMTPPSKTIYHKTISEFTVSSHKCLLAPGSGVSFNLVTGENYTGAEVDYDAHADFDVFVFNVSKYFQTSKQEKSVDKPWEGSIWRDAGGNLISLREHLRGLDDLVVITDEAHHFQRFTKDGRETTRGSKNSAGDVILDLRPGFVLEFTATMLRDHPRRRLEKAIYRYPLDRYIADGYGKRVRAWGVPLASLDLEGGEGGDAVTGADQYLIVVAMLVHAVKRVALGYRRGDPPPDGTPSGFKPILLVRARSRLNIENVYQFITGLPDREEFVKGVWGDLRRGRELPVVALLGNLTWEDVWSQVTGASENAFFIHYKNRNDPRVAWQFSTVEDNAVEVVVQQEVATEGWNVDNVYTILILSHSSRKVQTYVKQLIGRGLRLFKARREHDELPDASFPAQTEILHVVCDQGSQFKSFVSSIRQVRAQLGLGEEQFRVELPHSPGGPVPEPSRIRPNPLEDFLEAGEEESGRDLSLQALVKALEPASLNLDEVCEKLFLPGGDPGGKRVLRFNPTSASAGVELNLFGPGPRADGQPTTPATPELRPFSLSPDEVELVVDELIGRCAVLPWCESVREPLRHAVREVCSGAGGGVWLSGATDQRARDAAAREVQVTLIDELSRIINKLARRFE